MQEYSYNYSFDDNKIILNQIKFYLHDYSLHESLVYNTTSNTKTMGKKKRELIYVLYHVRWSK